MITFEVLQSNFAVIVIASANYLAIYGAKCNRCIRLPSGLDLHPVAYLFFLLPIYLLICNSSLQAHVLENQDKPRHGLVQFRQQDIPHYS